MCGGEEMMYAYPNEIINEKDLPAQIEASCHQGERGYCPVCGGEVISQKVHNVWQWVHLKDDKNEEL